MRYAIGEDHRETAFHDAALRCLSHAVSVYLCSLPGERTRLRSIVARFRTTVV